MADMPAVLAPYSDYLGEHIGDATPRKWYQRSQRDDRGKIETPMPEPDTYLGPSRQPAWYRDTIIDWFCRWKGLDRRRMDIWLDEQGIVRP
jgi:hypothetical protein